MQVRRRAMCCITCGKREGSKKLVPMVKHEKAAPVTGTTLRTTGPVCGLLTVNTVSTHLRDTTNSGLIFVFLVFLNDDSCQYII